MRKRQKVFCEISQKMYPERPFEFRLSIIMLLRNAKKNSEENLHLTITNKTALQWHRQAERVQDKNEGSELFNYSNFTARTLKQQTNI